MINAEWSLVFFTLLGQFSTGILLCALIYFFFLSPGKTQQDRDLTFRATLMAFVLMLIALVISFLHLSSPFSAIYALSNLKESWLSREILMASVYAFLTFVLFAYQYFRGKNTLIFNTLLIITVLSGLAMVYTMARIYMIETVPAWNSYKTILTFYGSVLLLGPALFLVIYANQVEKSPERQTGRLNIMPLTLIIAAGLLIKLFILLIPDRGIGEVSAGFFSGAYPGILVFSHWAFIAAGTLLVINNLQKSKSHIPVSGYYVTALLFFVLAEIIARAEFYASFFRIGI